MQLELTTTEINALRKLQRNLAGSSENVFFYWIKFYT